MKYIDLVLYIGIFVFALTGALKARASRMDVFGAFVMAFATAYGGGTIRDVLIGIRPVSWINDYFAFMLVSLATGITFLMNKNIVKFRNIFFITDSIGLGMFCIAGIEISLKHNINQPYAVVLGVISATFGGLIADVISNTAPALLKRGEIYATASAIGGIIYLILDLLSLSQNLRLLIAVAVILFIRFITKKKQIQLPKI